MVQSSDQRRSRPLPEKIVFIEQIDIVNPGKHTGMPKREITSFICQIISRECKEKGFDVTTTDEAKAKAKKVYKLKIAIDKLDEGNWLTRCLAVLAGIVPLMLFGLGAARIGGHCKVSMNGKFLEHIDLNDRRVGFGWPGGHSKSFVKQMLEFQCCKIANKLQRLNFESSKIPDIKSDRTS